MMKRISYWLFLIMLVCIWCKPLDVHAAEQLDTQRKGSITLHYSHKGIGFEDLDISIYRVADITPDMEFELVSPFDTYPVNVQGITSQKEWKITAETMAMYTMVGKVKPDGLAKTDADGTVTFKDMKAGLYLITEVETSVEHVKYSFENFFVVLPRVMDDGSFDYEIEAKPKYTSETPDPDEPGDPPVDPPEDPEDPTKPSKPGDPDDPEDPTKPSKPGDPDDPENPSEPGDPYVPVIANGIEYTVIKLWNDAGNQDSRPDGVTMDLYKNYEYHKSVTLNSENNWSYTWFTSNKDDKWVVIEKDVPDGYKVMITERENTFVVTNGKTASLTVLPLTGDSFPLWPVIVVMCISGMLLLIIGIWSRRKDES